jgi:hypothetical protein
MYIPFSFLAQSEIPFCTYKVGDLVEGGVVAYIYKPGDAGYNPLQQKGLILAYPNPIGGGVMGCINTDLSGAVGTAIGDGASNTAYIVANCNESTQALAATNYRGGGFSDWYLPSRDELYQVYLNQGLLPNNSFISNPFGTSTQNTADTRFYYFQSFYPPIPIEGSPVAPGLISKQTLSTIYPMRTFICNAPSYSVISDGLVLWNDMTTLTGSIWYDRSGNQNNGLVSGSALTLTGSLGYEFNGIDNYVTYPITLVGQPSGSWTMQYYGSLPSESINRDFFVKDSYANGWDTVFDPVFSSPAYTDRFLFRDTGGQDWKKTWNPGRYDQKKLITITVRTDIDSIGLWVNIYYEGAFFDGGPINNFNSANAPFRFGWNADGDATFWKGGVSSILLYNKVLSSEEIYNNYAYFTQQ